MNRYLSQAGIAARRKCDLLIKAGLVSVNGVVVRKPGITVDSSTDYILYNDKRVILNISFEYVLLNKPSGYVCTANDTEGRKTVFDLVASGARLFPVGRLDVTTTGLLLLTNDGELSYRLTHPRFGVEKVYRAVLHKSLHPIDLQKLQRDVLIGKNESVSAQIKVISKNRKVVELTVHEGKKNMIKRMFKVLGYIVVSLDRIKIGFLTKHKLPLGGWRYLTQKEVQKLHTMAGNPFTNK